MCRCRNLVTDIDDSEKKCAEEWTQRTFIPYLVPQPPRAARPQRNSQSLRAIGRVRLVECFAVGLRRYLLRGNETNLLDYFLTFGTDGEVDKLLHHSSWLAISIEKGRPGIRITFCQNTFLGRRGSINWNHLDSAGFSISQTNVANTIWIFADFLRDLLIAGELL